MLFLFLLSLSLFYSYCLPVLFLFFSYSILWLCYSHFPIFPYVSYSLQTWNSYIFSYVSPKLWFVGFLELAYCIGHKV